MQHVYIVYLSCRSGNFIVRVFEKLDDANDVYWSLPDNHVSKHGFDKENSWVMECPVL